MLSIILKWQKKISAECTRIWQTTDLITRVLSIGVMVVCGFLYMPIFSNSRRELIILKPAAI